MGEPARVRADDVAIVVIDVQPYFLDGWMVGATEPLLARIGSLFGLATVHDLPCVATFEEPVARKGWLPERLEPLFPAHGERHRKETFGCCSQPGIVEALERIGRRQVAVAGGETDVCVLQSVLGLLARGHEVFLLEDALFSSEPSVGPALRRMEAAGAVPSTVKTLSYELRHTVAVPSPAARLRDLRPDVAWAEPEDLPAWRDPLARVAPTWQPNDEGGRN